MTTPSGQSAQIDQLTTWDAPRLRRYFSETDVLDITALIRGATDAELRRLIARDDLRAEAVRAILERFAEFADPEALGAISGVVRFELARDRDQVERHTARFADGQVVLDEEAKPAVVVRAGIVDFVRLVTGEVNAALLYLSERLEVEGEALLALAVGGVFVVPGTGRAAVDPTALDPVDVATAVASSSTRHMKAVMEGDFRPVVLEEVFRRFPEFIDTGRARTLQLSVGFRIGGRRDGVHDRFTVHVAHGTCRIEPSPPEGQRRDATITLDGVDFLRLATGQLHPVRGVLSGALKVRGDRTKALALNAVMVPPQPRR